MLRMCVYMHSRFVENHPIRILEDGPLISEVVMSHQQCGENTSVLFHDSDIYATNIISPWLRQVFVDVRLNNRELL
jgi:hypothetical protein